MSEVGISGSKEGTSIHMLLMSVAKMPSEKAALFTPLWPTGQLCLSGGTCTKAVRSTQTHRPHAPLSMVTKWKQLNSSTLSTQTLQIWTLPVVHFAGF